MKKLNRFGKCPKCGEDWDAGEIFNALRKHKFYSNLDDAQLRARIKTMYSKPYHYSKIVGVEVQEKYDGVSYWQCPFCKQLWDRFTGKEVEKIE